MQRYDATPLAREFVELERAGQFVSRVGRTETVLPSLPPNAVLIPDVYDSYFYSANRALVLQQYYNALLPERGVAAVLVNAQPGALAAVLGVRTQFPVDTVHTASGEESLIQYLTKRYPRNFKLIKAGTDPVRFSWGTGLYGRQKRFNFEPSGFSEMIGGQLTDVLVIRKTPDLPVLALPLSIDLARRDWVASSPGFEFSTNNHYYEDLPATSR
jgi:hypothetical protein